MEDNDSQLKEVHKSRSVCADSDYKGFKNIEGALVSAQEPVERRLNKGTVFWNANVAPDNISAEKNSGGRRFRILL